MYVSAKTISDAEARYGAPRVRTVSYEISPPERAMILSSQRDGRAHDVTVCVFHGAHLAVIAKPNYPPGGYRVPGGALKPGEALDVGAAREAHEETGLAAMIERYLLRVHVAFTTGDDSLDWTTHVVSSSTTDDLLDVRDTREIREARWGSLDVLNGPVRQILLATGRGLFRYRTDLHLWIAESLAA